VSIIQSPIERAFAATALASIDSALRSYIAIEGDLPLAFPSAFMTERQGHAINVICSLHRAVEHFLKLRVYQIDPVLIYPLPKSAQDYLILQRQEYPNLSKQEVVQRYKKLTASTIRFDEALRLVEAFRCTTSTGYILRGFINLETAWNIIGISMNLT